MLNTKMIFKVLGIILITIAIAMVPSMVVAIFYKETFVLIALIKSAIPLLLIGLLLRRIMPITRKIHARDGYIIVALSWVLASLFSTLPYLFSGCIPNFADAFFEATSGISTTGSSILTDIEIMPKAILFWRTFTHWLGGMGILVFVVALLPDLGIGGLQIARVETTGHSSEKIASKMTDNAKILYLIYVGFTACETIFLMLGGMSLFDALCHSFSSMATGGFANYNDSIAHFGSLYIDFVVAIFSFLAAVNFYLYFYLLRGKPKLFFKDSELKFYALVVFSYSLLITIALSTFAPFENESFISIVRHAFFQVVAIITTLGFSTTDYEMWPTFTKLLLFSLMFIGGCSASTSGGVKSIRVLILIKAIHRNLKMKLYPSAIIRVRLGEKTVPSEIIASVVSFMSLYIILVLFGAFVISFDNPDFVTALSASAASISNVGPGFNAVGPSLNYSHLSDFSKIFLAFMMLIGRLELFTILLLFTPGFWKRRQ